MNTDDTEFQLRSALHRVVNNQPRNEVLQERLKRNELRVSILAVAMEAGVSRTLIGYEGCAYSSVREDVKKAILDSLESPAKETTRRKLERLALKISELEDELALRDLIQAEEVVRKYKEMQGLTPENRPLKPKPASQRRSEMRIVNRKE